MGAPQFDPSLFSGTSGPFSSGPITLEDRQAPIEQDADAVNETFTMEDLANIDTKHADSVKLQVAGLFPAGWYQTDPDEFGEMNVLPSIQKDFVDGEPVGASRKVVKVSGRVKGKFRDPKAEGGVRLVTARVDFTIAAGPGESRPRTNFDTGEVLGGIDLKTQLYTQAEGTYLKVVGEESPNLLAITEFLKTGVYAINLRQIGAPSARNPVPSGEPKNFVQNIAPLKRTKNK